MVNLCIDRLELCSSHGDHRTENMSILMHLCAYNVKFESLVLCLWKIGEFLVPKYVGDLCSYEYIVG